MKRALTALGLAALLGCGSNATPAISNLSIDSPVTAATSGVFLVSGQVQVSDSSGDSALTLDFTFIDATGRSSAFTVPLTPGGSTNDAEKDELIPFDFQLGATWAKGTYSVRAAVTDGNGGHTSTTLDTTVVLQ
jgi:hypothetical protein